MLRFPNPGSTIDNFVSVYGAAFDRLNGQIVGLDDIVAAVVAANLATSSGHMGEAAVARSTRADRSRDPLYNQLKMYAELFRTLGWLHPTPESSLKFTFTLLGEQIVAAGRDFWPLLEECVIGIIYPTPTLAVKGTFDLRPFAFILRTMAACGGYLSRDEMIIGPLSAASDRQPNDLATVARTIKNARRSPAVAAQAIASLAEQRHTQVNTLQNYTRWPIALLRDTKWVEQGSAAYKDGTKYRIWQLTETGRQLATHIEHAADIRVDDLNQLAPREKQALAVASHFRMLERSGFDISPVTERLVAAELVAKPGLTRLMASDRALLFSPFQTLTLSEITTAFPDRSHSPHVEFDQTPTAIVGPDGRNDRSHLFVSPTYIKRRPTMSANSAGVRAELQLLIDSHSSLNDAASTFCDRHSRDTQTVFYPLVAHLFQALGFKSDFSRAGVNYQRWDACVWIGSHVLPVEVKSPTEEVYLSTKAVRQALENKVILLSRGGLDTHRDLTSLVVGYRLPNERGDMSNLIDDVFSAYGLRLGVIDLNSLALLAMRSIHDGVTIDATQLGMLRGFIDV